MMDVNPSENAEFSWIAFLDSIAKQGRTEAQLPDSEITKQLQAEWEPYLVMRTERIQ